MTAQLNTIAAVQHRNDLYALAATDRLARSDSRPKRVARRRRRRLVLRRRHAVA